MSYEMVGLLHVKYETQSKTDTFQAREFVVKTDGTYPQFIKFQLTQDRCGILDTYNVGDMMKVYFDLRGREWNEKYFTNLQAWKLEPGQAEAAAPPQAQATSENAFPAMEYPAANNSNGASQSKAEDFDDLPF